MSDFPTTLRVIAAYKAGEDLAERLATAVAVQQSMSDALLKAAEEIERLRLTSEEREAIEFFTGFHNDGYGLIESHAATLRKMLERLT